MIKTGDIVKTSYGTGPYRVLSVSGPYTHPCYVDSINMADPPPSPPHYCMTVVPVRIPVGKERPSDHCYLNGYAPTGDPAAWRNVWRPDEFYILGHAAGAQLALF